MLNYIFLIKVDFFLPQISKFDKSINLFFYFSFSDARIFIRSMFFTADKILYFYLFILLYYIFIDSSKISKSSLSGSFLVNLQSSSCSIAFCLFIS